PASPCRPWPAPTRSGRQRTGRRGAASPTPASAGTRHRLHRGWYGSWPGRSAWAQHHHRIRGRDHSLAVTLGESTRAVRVSLTERDFAAAKRALSAVGDDDES